MTAVPHRILVVANETVGGRALIDAVKTHAQEAHERGEPFHVTLSAGVASFPDDGGDTDRLLQVADRRLYLAKDAGRARVCSSG